MPPSQVGHVLGGAHVFVYGTLVDPAKLDEVVGHRHQGERLRARVHGYRRVLADGYEYAFLVPQSDASVEGVLVMDLTAADLVALDAYEDVEGGVYERLAVDVEVWGCGPNAMHVGGCSTYVGGPRLRALASHSVLTPS